MNSSWPFVLIGMILFSPSYLLFAVQAFAATAPAVPSSSPVSSSLRDIILDELTQNGNRKVDRIRLNKLICDLELSCDGSIGSSNGQFPSFPHLWHKLDGEWRLLYSNNGGPATGSAFSKSTSSSFSSSSNPIIENQLFKLEKVTQRFKKNLGYPGIGSLDDLQYTCENVLYIETPVISAEIILCHTAYPVSMSAPASLAIELDSVETSSSLPLPNFNIDYRKILGPSFLRKGIFDTTYCDDQLRISRGNNGETRVFVKE